ncbi:MAG: peptidase A8, partial [Candidatus Tectomicrobia bacterium]|nr:peptidase A8 [Candidatus Tectomicrobia bacterium]
YVQWTPAGFLGDELPSEQYPNQKLLDKALRSIRAGDILVMHLGIWSRQEPFYLILESLITGLQAKGLCFTTLGE